MSIKDLKDLKDLKKEYEEYINQGFMLHVEKAKGADNCSMKVIGSTPGVMSLLATLMEALVKNNALSFKDLHFILDTVEHGVKNESK